MVDKITLPSTLLSHMVDTTKVSPATDEAAAGANATRDAIVLAAVQEIARHGIGGLRLRSVAQAAGVHHATLLYHFPSRPELVRAAAEYVRADFRRGRMRDLGVASPLDELRRQFEESRARTLEGSPTLSALVHLLVADDGSDARAVADDLIRGWRYHVAGILRRGARAGVFRTDVDPGTAAEVLVTHLIGVAARTAHSGPAATDHAALGLFQGLIERWLCADDPATPES